MNKSANVRFSLLTFLSLVLVVVLAKPVWAAEDGPTGGGDSGEEALGGGLMANLQIMRGMAAEAAAYRQSHNGADPPWLAQSAVVKKLNEMNSRRPASNPGQPNAFDKALAKFTKFFEAPKPPAVNTAGYTVNSFDPAAATWVYQPVKVITIDNKNVMHDSYSMLGMGVDTQKHRGFSELTVNSSTGEWQQKNMGVVSANMKPKNLGDPKEVRLGVQPLGGAPSYLMRDKRTGEYILMSMKLVDGFEPASWLSKLGPGTKISDVQFVANFNEISQENGMANQLEAVAAARNIMGGCGSGGRIIYAK